MKESELMRRDMIKKMEERRKALPVSSAENDAAVTATKLETVADKPEPIALVEKKDSSANVSGLQTQPQVLNENAEENVKSSKDEGTAQVQAEV
jgi:hypothetical protein